jgi:hypothetical protein
LRDWNAYLKIIYESPNAMDKIPNNSIEDQVFSIEDIEFWVKRLTKEKSKDIEGYQVEISKVVGTIPIHHIHKFFNLEVK